MKRGPDEILREINALHRKMLLVRFGYGAVVVSVLAAMALSALWVFVKLVKLAIFLDW